MGIIAKGGDKGSGLAICTHLEKHMVVCIGVDDWTKEEEHEVERR